MENHTTNLPQYQSLAEASGNLKYITLNDLIEQSYERFLDESTKDNFNIMLSIEEKTISKVKSLLSSRYDIVKIFNEETPIKSDLLVEIIATITVYKILKRNAPRKINSQMVEDYNEANRNLEKLATGRLVLNDLQKPTDENGNTKTDSIYFNNSNRNFYI